MSNLPPDIGKLYHLKTDTCLYKDAWASECIDDDDAEIESGGLVLVAEAKRMMEGTWADQWSLKVIHKDLIGYLLTDSDWTKTLRARE